MHPPRHFLLCETSFNAAINTFGPSFAPAFAPKIKKRARLNRATQGPFDQTYKSRALARYVIQEAMRTEVSLSLLSDVGIYTRIKHVGATLTTEDQHVRLFGVVLHPICYGFGINVHYTQVMVEENHQAFNFAVDRHRLHKWQAKPETATARCFCKQGDGILSGITNLYHLNSAGMIIFVLFTSRMQGVPGVPSNLIIIDLDGVKLQPLKDCKWLHQEQSQSRQWAASGHRVMT